MPGCRRREKIEQMEDKDIISGSVKKLWQYGNYEWLLLLLRMALGLMFVYASYDKILHPQAFSLAVYNYQILPDMLINLTALVLPWLELILGLCLMSGAWLPGATALSSGLLSLFLGVLVFNLLRGLDIHCGCFSTEAVGKPAGGWTILRDIGFLAVSFSLTVLVLFPERWRKTIPRPE